MATQTTVERLASTLFQPVRKEYLSFREASTETSLSERHLRRLYAQGRLQARRVGRRLLISRESLDNLLS